MKYRLAKPFKVSAPAITKHMRILEQAGLLSGKRQGREHHCRIGQKRLKEAGSRMGNHRKFWNERLDALAHCLKESP